MANLEEGSSSGHPRYLTAFDDLLLFDLANGSGAWRSDGTEAGTWRVASVARFLQNPVPLGSRAYFCGSTGSGVELMSVDGSLYSALLVKDLNPGSGNGCVQVVAAGDRLALSGNDGEHGLGLWISDGTTEGTELVFEGSSMVDEMVAIGGHLYFAATSRLGRELWRSDGTAAGTELLADVNPGSSGSQPESLETFEGALYFSAIEEHVGRELWHVVPERALAAPDVRVDGGCPLNRNRHATGGD